MCRSVCILLVMESLWKEFIRSRYHAPLDEKLLGYVIKMSGKHFKKFYFADHIGPSTIQLLLKYCKNVIHLRLLSFNYNTY